MSDISDISDIGNIGKAQEIYDKFLAQKIHCRFCDLDVPFSKITDWAEESGPIAAHCPWCQIAIRIDDVEINAVIHKLAEIDKRIADVIIKAGDAGKLVSADSYKIAMIIKYHIKFKQQLGWDKPLSFIDRMSMRAVYNEVVSSGAGEPIDIYEAIAPIPVDFVKPPPIVAPTFSGLGAKKRSGKRKKKKDTQRQHKLGFGFVPPTYPAESIEDTDSTELFNNYLKGDD